MKSLKFTSPITLARSFFFPGHAAERQAQTALKDSCPQRLGTSERRDCELMHIRDLNRKIRNEIREILNTIVLPQEIVEANDIRCFKKAAIGRQSSFSVRFTKKVTTAQLRDKDPQEIAEFRIGYGESVYILPVGRIKYGEAHEPVEPIGTLHIARKIGDHVGPWTRHNGEVIKVVAPDSMIASVVWQVVDQPLDDNEEFDLVFAYRLMGGTGSVSPDILKDSEKSSAEKHKPENRASCS